MEWKIEKGVASDVRTIAQFQLDMAMESEGTQLDIDQIMKGVSSAMADSNKGTYYLVKAEDGTTAGSLLITKEWSDWTDRWYWWIQSVFVAPQFRRQGAYSALYSEIKRLAREDGSSSVRLYVDRENIKAQNCYKKYGMDECHYLMYEEKL